MPELPFLSSRRYGRADRSLRGGVRESFELPGQENPSDARLQRSGNPSINGGLERPQRNDTRAIRNRLGFARTNSPFSVHRLSRSPNWDCFVLWANCTNKLTPQIEFFDPCS